jgi:hypothetical protein
MEAYFKEFWNPGAIVYDISFASGSGIMAVSL